jgi:hypothetical protein
LSKQGLSQPYMALKQAIRTFFYWEEKQYNVRQAQPIVFDGWVRQYVEEIVDVDTEEWDVYDRWQIVNALLSEKFLLMIEGEDGSSVLQRGPGKRAEVKSSPSVSDENVPKVASKAELVG